MQQGIETACWNNPVAEHLLCYALLDAKVTEATLKRLLLLQANWLKSVGVRKGDAVAIYMPMVRFPAPAAQPCINDASPIWGQFEPGTQTTHSSDALQYMPPCSTFNGPGHHVFQGGVSIHLLQIAQKAGEALTVRPVL